MIGTVTFGLRPQAAVLNDDLTWSCPNKMWERYLNGRFRREEISEADGSPGLAWLHEAAELLKGEAEVAKLPQPYPKPLA